MLADCSSKFFYSVVFNPAQGHQRPLFYFSILPESLYMVVIGMASLIFCCPDVHSCVLTTQIYAYYQLISNLQRKIVHYTRLFTTLLNFRDSFHDSMRVSEGQIPINCQTRELFT